MRHSTCDDYFDVFVDTRIIDDMISFGHSDFEIFDAMVDYANSKQVLLIDIDDFDYEEALETSRYWYKIDGGR